MSAAMSMEEMPLRALSSRTRSELTALNTVKILPSENGFPRDWQGIANLAMIPTSAIVGYHSPIAKLLQLWSEKPLHQANLQLFIDYLQQIDRYDVLDDITHLIEKDIENYMYNTNVSNSQLSECSNFKVIQPLTMHDNEITKQKYDAFIVYADNDKDFAQEVIDKMEEYGLKICQRADLLAGIMEHSAMIDLITERCDKLIVILTPDFFESSENTFLANFAQAVGIEQRKRKIVPCIYKRCEIPFNLKFYSSLDYNRYTKWNFWEKFRDSIKTPENQQMNSTRQLVSTQLTTPALKAIAPSPPILQSNDTKMVQQKKLQHHKEVAGSVNNLDEVQKNKMINITDITKSMNNLCVQVSGLPTDIPDLPSVDSSSLIYSNNIENEYTKKKMKKKRKLFPKIRRFFEKPLQN